MYASDTLKQPVGAQFIVMKGSKGSFQTAKHVARQYMPHPKRFRHVWKKRVGESAVYFWRPVPPSKKFIALGMVVTCADQWQHLHA